TYQFIHIIITLFKSMIEFAIYNRPVFSFVFQKNLYPLIISHQPTSFTKVRIAYGFTAIGAFVVAEHVRPCTALNELPIDYYTLKCSIRLEMFTNRYRSIIFV